MTRRDVPEPVPATSAATLLVAGNALAQVSAVVLDWDQAVAAEGEADTLSDRVSGVTAAGIDVWLVADGALPELAAPGPGRILAGTGDRVGELGGEQYRGTADQLLVIDTGAEALAILDRLIAAHSGFPEMSEDETWRLEVHGFDPLREREVESWLTLANGRTGTRGSLEEPHEHSSPAVYVAGIYTKAEDRVPGPDLIRGPHWTQLTPQAGGEPVSLDPEAIVAHRRVLDLRQGLLFRDWTQRLPSGEEWTFRSVRFASLADRGVLALQCQAAAGGAPVELADGEPTAEAQEGVSITSDTMQSGAALVTLTSATGGTAKFATRTHERGGHLDRLVAVTRAAGDFRDGDAAKVLAEAESRGLAAMRARHRRAWLDRWRDADLVVGADADLQRAVRFAIAALIGTGDPESDLASIGARGLSGSGYRGHVFWDTDVFILPFFIWTHPPTARALLSYRHRTLPAARAKAAEAGYAGALYAWESTDSGDETTPLFAWRADGTRIEILTGELEHHISADVAWATWQYWQVTGDDEFLVTKGAEIIIETARFWASRAELGDDGRYHIDHVIGPDEYHEDVLDNAYTNVLARWNLTAAVQLVDILGGLDASALDDLTDRLALRPAEILRWREVAERLVDGFDPNSLLYEQFAGFFEMEDVRAVDVEPRPFAGDIVLGIPRVRRSQMVKQADVVMLPLMLPQLMPPEVVEANYRYYEPRTSHGSSLSPAPHAAVAARIGALDEAERYFRMAASIDLSDHMGNASQGLHFAAMGGLWQAAVLGFGGVRPEGEALRVDPVLPPGWSGLRFAVRWRGTRVGVDVTLDGVTVDLDSPVTIALGKGEPSVHGPGRSSARFSPPNGEG